MEDTDEVLEGVIPILLPIKDRATVGVVSSGVGEWVWAAMSLGFTIAWVWCGTTEQLPMWLASETPQAIFTTCHSRGVSSWQRLRDRTPKFVRQELMLIFLSSSNNFRKRE